MKVDSLPECEQFTGRMRDICNGNCDRPLTYINRFRVKRGLKPLLDRPSPFAVASNASVRMSGRTSGSPSVTSGTKRHRTIYDVMTFAKAAMKFIGDGLKTTSPEEKKRRLSTCDSCPLKHNRRCEICTCNLPAKASMRLEQCPVAKWLPSLRERRPLNDVRRNLIMHILPVTGNGIWQWNVAEIAKRQHLFNGKRVVAVAQMSGKQRVQQRHGRSFATDPTKEVEQEFAKHGMRIDEVIEVPNSTTLREVVSFLPMLRSVKSNDPHEVTFNCHAKGVTHFPESVTIDWARIQYHVCLDHWETIQNALEQYSMAGSFRRFGQFTTPGNNRWHYSGTFYWFRHDDTFSREWQAVDNKFFGTESWPGRMFTADECACIFHDNCQDLYKDNYWPQVTHELKQWDAARGF